MWQNLNYRFQIVLPLCWPGLMGFTPEKWCFQLKRATFLLHSWLQDKQHGHFVFLEKALFVFLSQPQNCFLLKIISAGEKKWDVFLIVLLVLFPLSHLKLCCVFQLGFLPLSSSLCLIGLLTAHSSTFHLPGVIHHSFHPPLLLPLLHSFEADVFLQLISLSRHQQQSNRNRKTCFCVKYYTWLGHFNSIINLIVKFLQYKSEYVNTLINLFIHPQHIQFLIMINAFQ